MLTDNLYCLKKEDVPKAVGILKDAFKDDPLWAVVFPQNPKREDALTGFFSCPVLYGMKYGKVFATSSGLEGIASWVPGKYAEMTMFRMLLCGALPFGAKLSGEPIRTLSVIGKQLEKEKKKVLKNKPYVYLSIIGVAQNAQGLGYGSKLLNAIKEECARDGVYLYLETETEENVKFYEKHGFKVLQKLMLDRINLPLWQMGFEPNPGKSL